MAGCGEQYSWSSHILSDGQPQPGATQPSFLWHTDSEQGSWKHAFAHFSFSGTLCLTVMWILWFIPTKSQKRPGFKIATVCGKKMKGDSLSFHRSAWEWENRGSPLGPERLEQGSPCDQGIEYVNKKKPVCVGLLLSASLLLTPYYLILTTKDLCPHFTNKETKA